MAETSVLPQGQNIPESELTENFVKLSDTPYGNDDLAYSVVLPNDWLQLGIEAEDDVLHAGHPKLLANFLSPIDRDANAMLQVWGQGLIKEIAAGDWLKWYLVETGRTPDSVQIVSPYFADAIAHCEIEGVPYTMRVMARLASNRMFILQAMAPSDLYPDYADTFGLAVTSFKVAKEFENPHVEPWQTHTLDAAVTFNAPLSWPERKPEEAPEGLDAVDLFNLNAQGEPLGVLKAMTFRRSILEGKGEINLAAVLVDEFVKMNVEILEIVSDEPVSPAEPFGAGSFKTMTARLPKGDDRLRNLLVAEVYAPDHVFLIGLLTCAPKEGYNEYAVNRRALDIALETLRVQ